MEVNGTIVFFNEAEAVCDLEAPKPEELELKKAKPKKQAGKRAADLSALPVQRVDHYLTEEELTAEFGKNGWKQLPDMISRCYQFISAKVEVEEHHIGVYSGKVDEHMVKAPHPRKFLKDYTGICVTDGYQVYHTLEKEREDLKIAGCWVHCRRRFNDALEIVPKVHRKESVLYLIMNQIRAIYREEGKLSDLSSEDRLTQRQLVVKPLVDAFFAYLKQISSKTPQNGKVKDAFTYALNQERYLRVFLEDGDVPIDNNAGEWAIRGFCIGKKNWEMIDTINGATSSAIIYSIAETAKANNLKPYDYFEYLLTEISKHEDDTNTDFLEALLPWSETLPEHIRKPVKRTEK